MANPWFRMYSEFATDPKVQMMPEAMQRRLVMLFCMRCGDVTVTLGDDEIAFHLRISDAELAETKALFIAKGFIDSKWSIKNWDKRQFASDSSAARTRAYRDRKRDKAVTSQVTKGDALDTDTDTDTEEAKASLSKAAPLGGDADSKTAKGEAVRLAQVTDEAIAAFNAASLTRRNGGNLANVSETVGREKRQQQVKRCLRTARAICIESTGSPRVTAEFWEAYFDLAAGDEFYSGRKSGGPGHENYVPDFELLTREATMLKLYDRGVAE